MVQKPVEDRRSDRVIPEDRPPRRHPWLVVIKVRPFS